MGNDAERWRRIEDLCHQAWNLPEYEREAFLAEACGDDHGLRQEVQELLAQQSSANRFLETPVDAVAAAVLPRPRASLTGRTLGALEIGTLSGAGGMGEVYRATDTVLKRQVALKVLPPEVANNPERIARFQREAEVLGALNHPNIARLYGLERSRGTLALVMELVQGADAGGSDRARSNPDRRSAPNRKTDRRWPRAGSSRDRS